jgi:hypothetical protein
MSDGTEVFELTIRLGNAEMQTGGDVADALRKLADRIDTRRGGVFQEVGVVRDVNGNTCGNWSVV